MKIKQLPETERPYEKLELYGENNLSNAELLAIIIKTGTKEETSVELAQKILNLNDTKVDNLSFLQNLTIEELTKLKGIGKIKAIQLKALCELSKRMSKPSNYKRITIKKPYDLAKILMGDMRLQKKEVVKIVILNNKNQIIKIKDIALGGTNIAHLSLKDIISDPLRIGAPKIMLVHNHPSGDPTPSKQDITFTNYVYEKALEFDIELIDHLVIGDMNYISIFSEMMLDTK